MKDIYRAKVFFNDVNKKNYLTIFKEVIALTIRKKEIPFYYFKHLYKKEVTNIQDYLGSQEIGRIFKYTKQKNADFSTILVNKLAYCHYLEYFDLPTPKLTSFNHHGNFFLHRKLRSLKSEAEVVHFFMEVFNTFEIDSLFLRPLSQLGGKGCFKITRDDCEETISLHFKDIIASSYVHNMVIPQHPDINAIYSGSINTLRIVTLMTPDNSIEIVYALLRVGSGNSITDNATVGGFVVGINMDSGTLKKKGRRFLEFGGDEILHHPDTNFRFEGFVIPYFDEACQLVKTALPYLPSSLVGWDIAITPTGPTIIEANHNPDLHMTDVAYGGLLQNSHFNILNSSLKR